MRSVFEGGEGSIRGGRLERSSERSVLGLFDAGLDDGDVGGETLCATIVTEVVIWMELGEQRRDIFDQRLSSAGDVVTKWMEVCKYGSPFRNIGWRRRTRLKRTDSRF